MNKTKSGGFTLIELLVVIAIIGLLAAVVLFMVASARMKGSDAALKQRITQVVNQVELVTNGTGQYGPPYSIGVCPQASYPPDSIFYSDVHLRAMIKTISDQAGMALCAAGTTSGVGNATSWAIAAPLSGTTHDWWCADSAGGHLITVQSFGSFVDLNTYQIYDGYFPNLGGGSSGPAQCR